MGKRDMGVPVDQVAGVPRKVPKKLDITKLADAVVDGKMTLSVGGHIIVERTAWKKGTCIPALSICAIMKLEADGTVYTWDETRQQVFMFSAKAADLPPIKVWKE
jgi:hypothetical protein